MNYLTTVENVIHGIESYPISRDAKTRIYCRFICWQCIKRFHKKGKTIDWINGKKLIIYPGRASAVGNFYYGLLEYEPMAFLFHYLRYSDVFFDIGANVGVYTVLASNAKQIVSFEPGSDTFSILKRNIDINKMDNVVLVNKAVGEKEGVAMFTCGHDSTNHVIKSKESIENMEEVKIVDLDSYAQSEDLYPTVIKLDIEGAEAEAITGARKILHDINLNVVIMEVFDNEALIDMIEDFGFTLCTYNPNTKKLTKAERQIGNNGIFIRNIEEAKERCADGDNIVYQGRIMHWDL